MSRVTLRERFFPLHQPDDVDRFLDRFPWSVIFKAGTSDKTIDAWMVAQNALEPRVDIAVGFVRLPEDRPASDRVSALSGVAHRSPQLLVFQNARALFHLDEFAIVPDQLVPLLREHLPADAGPPVRNEAVVTLEPYRRLLSEFVDGTLPEERFQWGYLDRLQKEALWRDDETFALLNSLFENEWGRDVRAARLVAVEFQGQLAGRFEPLKERAARMLERLAGRGGPDDRLL
jgi:bacillithiol system protein YtxJ